MPVKDGEARGALSANALVNAVLFMAPPTNKLPLNELSEATLRRELKDTSPFTAKEPSITESPNAIEPFCDVINAPPIEIEFEPAII